MQRSALALLLTLAAAPVPDFAQAAKSPAAKTAANLTNSPGGAAPLCYPKDVTDEMVREYRESHEETK